MSMERRFEVSDVGRQFGFVGPCNRANIERHVPSLAARLTPRLRMAWSYPGNFDGGAVLDGPCGRESKLGAVPLHLLVNHAARGVANPLDENVDVIGRRADILKKACPAIHGLDTILGGQF